MCDVIKPEERCLWEAQDILTGALPQALSEAFQTVEHDFLQTSKVCPLVSSSCRRTPSIPPWVSSKLAFYLTAYKGR